MARRTYQRVGDFVVDRTDHVWLKVEEGYLCCLCGGLTRTEPPAYPTPARWLPEATEALTPGDRELVAPPRAA